MADFVDGFFFGFGEFAGCVEGVFFEEEADLVAGCEEVFVADVVGFFAGGKPREGVVGDGEVAEEGVCFAEEGGYC